MKQSSQLVIWDFTHKVSQGGFKNVRNSCFGIWDTFFRTCSFCGFPKTAKFRVQMTSHAEPLALRTFRLSFFTNSFIQSTTTSDTTASSRKGKNMIHQDALHPQRYQRVLHAPTWAGLFLATTLEAFLKNRCIYAYEWYNTSLLQAKSWRTHIKSFATRKGSTMKTHLRHQTLSQPRISAISFRAKWAWVVCSNRISCSSMPQRMLSSFSTFRRFLDKAVWNMLDGCHTNTVNGRTPVEIHWNLRKNWSLYRYQMVHWHDFLLASTVSG